MGDIAERVSLSTSAVSAGSPDGAAGVISGYTVVVDHASSDGPSSLHRVRFAGRLTWARSVPPPRASQVQAVFTTAGDPDALVWIRVQDVEAARLGHRTAAAQCR